MSVKELKSWRIVSTPTMRVAACDHSLQDGAVFIGGELIETISGAYVHGTLTTKASERLKALGKNARIVVGRFTRDSLDYSA